MVDIVKANEFTFSPSSFIAAYVENTKEDGSVVETTANGGTLSTVADDLGFATSLINANKELATTQKIPSIEGDTSVTATVTANGGTLSSFSAAAPQGIQGISPEVNGPLTISGSVVDFLGQTVTDTRTTNKTTTSSFTLSVVLVLTYGTFKSPAVDRNGALATVSLIHDQVAAYLNSL